VQEEKCRGAGRNTLNLKVKRKKIYPRKMCLVKKNYISQRLGHKNQNESIHHYGPFPPNN